MPFFNNRYLRRISIVLTNTSISRFIIFLLFCVIIVHYWLMCIQTANMSEIKSQLKKAKSTNGRLRQKIDDILIKQVAYIYAHDSPAPDPSKSRQRLAQHEPTLEYEQLRRRIQTNILEMWSYFNYELNQIKNDVASTSSPTIESQINQVLELGVEHKRSLLSDMERLRQVDGYEAWRQTESKFIGDLVQHRLQKLQNPENCYSAPKLLCSLDKACGYGCQLHHVVYCFIIAYASERTVILKSRGWRYNSGGWEQVFQPISESCLSAEMSLASKFSASWYTKPLWKLPIIDRLKEHREYLEFLPLTIPADLAPRLLRFNGDPASWWVGQFLKYLLKPQQKTSKFFESNIAKLDWKKPIVGVHVRRTDKVGTESDFHSIEEYMAHVEDYFLTLEINNNYNNNTNNTNNVVTRRIFLATDEPSVIDEARLKYPHYEVVSDPDVARSAAFKTRYTAAALNNIILDIHLLSMSDYLVCTFSSQVCRVAYEIMQTLYSDASHRFKSLDDIYYYGGQNAHHRQTVIGHKSRNSKEIDLEPGDLIKIAGNHWNGFSKGTNTRTNATGLFPSFMVVDKVETSKFPTYMRLL